ncbi:MAG: cytochrome c-type biogenesis protein [Candidatus Methanoperedens nitroreducens]|uniref:Cytochrome c-type biogenesis protein n=1 Tax=Candidatus Methanoperedens nitratireducens TaxID=1392998 RepID=A0A0P8AF81_9EURY|nr:cytochrome c biogenesis protein CcsA [Candidatus Methanoperedens sp. BLZ2]KAB2948502.1 MAG: hypothetical protein F9K14_01350 [Candidatus Methanoperedens sp.]KPQ42933.1 MAG: cytochrome c-type biogenesis protein [Candidatus Methanoperedens sp. BLZ1]MBZ0174393.1 cytochrome c biogenesis protein CcsA [Candidatus Methanoperedens nitroreducens]MCX9078413.1 cytochrome c biogenesis protein CcsA [Candidatus Methanoperedens sp.]
MDTGNILLLIGLIASIASLSVYKLNRRYFLYALILAFLFISSAVLLLVYYFISNDLSINYVYIYSGDLPVVYRIAAMWAGKQGMQLLLVWATMLFILLFYMKNQENNGFARKISYIALGIVILFLSITLLDSPFRPAPGSSEAGILSGHGLSPKMISFWFLIHPPLVVMAYAAIIILFASAITYLFSGEKEWVVTARSWGRASWLLLSLAMATGGAWAYETVGWDGFWKWDPAQSGALIIWLVLTAVLHAIIRHQRNFREYDTTAPLLSACVFILSLYVMFFSRKGVQGSEHNFLGSDIWAILFAAMLFTTIITLYLIMRRKSEESGWKMTLNSMNSLRTSFHTAILLLCMLAFVPFWGITHSIIPEKIFGDQILIPKEVYNFWSFPIILLLITLTGYSLLQGVVKQKVLKLITLLAIFTGAVTAFFPGPTLLDPASEFYQQSTFLGQSIGSVSVISYIPISLFGVGGIFFRFIHGKHRFSCSNTGIGLIHAGFIFIVAGAISSTSLSTEGTVGYTALELNIPKGIDAVWRVSVTDISTTVKADNGSEQVLNLNFYKNGNPHGSGVVSLSKSDRIGNFHKLLVHRTLFTDIMVHYDGDALNPSSIRLRTEMMPLVNVLWGGTLLMIGGIIFLMKPNLSSKTG